MIHRYLQLSISISMTPIFRMIKKAVFNVYVKDTKTGHYYRGTAYAKQGSNQISVRMDYLKLKSNTKYQVYYMVNDKGWAQGKTFTAK